MRFKFSNRPCCQATKKNEEDLGPLGCGVEPAGNFGNTSYQLEYQKIMPNDKLHLYMIYVYVSDKKVNI